jgi:hypothetical protein
VSQGFDPLNLFSFESGRHHARAGRPKRYAQAFTILVHRALGCRYAETPASPNGRDRRKLRRCAGLALTSGALGSGAGDILGIARPSRVQAIAPGAEMRNLQEAANNHDVLEKMDHLISVSKVVVKEDRRCQREHCKARCHISHTKTKDQQ